VGIDQTPVMGDGRLGKQVPQQVDRHRGHRAADPEDLPLPPTPTTTIWMGRSSQSAGIK